MECYIAAVSLTNEDQSIYKPMATLAYVPTGTIFNTCTFCALKVWQQTHILSIVMPGAGITRVKYKLMNKYTERGSLEKN